MELVVFLVFSGSGLLLPCQNGVWIVANDNCPLWAGDLNYLEGTPAKTTCINGGPLASNAPSVLTNAPSGDWYFVEVFRHVNSANYYVIQRATGMTGSATNIVYQRVQQSDTSGKGWSDWSVDNNSCPYFGGDLNTIEGNPGTMTCVHGLNMINAPTSNNDGYDWYTVEVFRYYAPNSYYGFQRATAWTGPNAGNTYIRTQNNGTGTPYLYWGAWNNVSFMPRTKITYINTLGVVDLGWAYYCSLGLSAMENTNYNASSVWMVAGPDINGRYHWNASVQYANNSMYAVCM